MSALQSSLFQKENQLNRVGEAVTHDKEHFPDLIPIAQAIQQEPDRI